MPFAVIGLLKVGIWVIFLITLSRAYKKEKLTTLSARRMWLMFFLWNIAFTLWDESGEILIDWFFKGLPVGLFVKSACMVLTFHVYYHMLKPLKPYRPSYRLLDCLAPIMLVTGLVSFLLYSLFEPISYADLRFFVVAVRDLTMLVYVLTVFIPYTLLMWRNEYNWSLKLKQFAALTCFTCYSLVALSGIGAGIITLLDGPDAEAIAASTDPAVYVGFVAFMVTLVPYRWLSMVFHLERIFAYCRLRRIENTITQAMHVPSTSKIGLAQLMNPNELELFVYRTLISVLDHYHVTQFVPYLEHLHTQIEAVVHQNQEYADLVKGLTRVKV